MSEHPADSSENRLRATVAGALTFVSFGLLAGLVLWIADFRTGARATEVGQFTPEQIETRTANLIEVEAAQSSLFDSEKVESSMKAVSGKPAKATETVIPGSETDLKNMAANAAKAEAEKAAAEKEAANTEKPASDPPASDKPTVKKPKNGGKGTGKKKAKAAAEKATAPAEGDAAQQN